MRYRALKTVLIAASVLLSAGCGTSRRTVSSSHSEQQKVKSEELKVERDSVALEVYDTITITKTITVDRNETGDTLRLTQVTDRYRGHDALKLRDKSEKIKVVHDTVYVEKRDSVDVKESRMAGSGNQGGKTALHGTLKWIFYIILGLIALVITVRVCLRKW